MGPQERSTAHRVHPQGLPDVPCLGKVGVHKQRTVFGNGEAKIDRPASIATARDLGHSITKVQIKGVLGHVAAAPQVVLLQVPSK